MEENTFTSVFNSFALEKLNPNHSKLFFTRILLAGVFLLISFLLVAQPVTGVWRGRIIRGTGLRQSTAPVELKLVAQGDSILGAVYYYGKGKSYIRYSVKGYFGKDFNTVYWQDYHMMDMYPKKPDAVLQFSETMKSKADFSCPDGRNMFLDGTCQLPDVPEMKIELRKMDDTFFPDEWDDVIEGYFTGMARKEVVDSVWMMGSEPYIAKTAITIVKDDVAKTITITEAPPGIKTPDSIPAVVAIAAPPEIKEPQTIKSPDSIPVAVAIAAPPVTKEPETSVPHAAPPAIVKTSPPVNRTTPDITEQIAKAKREQQKAAPPVVKPAPPPVVVVPVPSATLPPAVATVIVATQPIPDAVMEEAFKERRKIVQTTIPAIGDTLELRFYDNADVDGDSISLFLNGIALFQHVRLDVKPYIFKIPVQSLPDISELAMVAENLGAIPPNTAFMEAFVNGQRYTARIESTENTTGVIKLVKKE